MPTPARASRECRSWSCFRPQNCGAVSGCSARPGQLPAVARLSQSNNKFRLQSARSTTNEKRAADPKLARLRRHFHKVGGFADDRLLLRRSLAD